MQSPVFLWGYVTQPSYGAGRSTQSHCILPCHVWLIFLDGLSFSQGKWRSKSGERVRWRNDWNKAGGEAAEGMCYMKEDEIKRKNIKLQEFSFRDAKMTQWLQDTTSLSLIYTCMLQVPHTKYKNKCKKNKKYTLYKFCSSQTKLFTSSSIF